MIVHNILDEEGDWKVPEWLPEVCLTWSNVS
jgi:hypothetical protein